MTRVDRSWSIFGSLSIMLALLLVTGCQSESSQNQQSAPPPLPDNEIAIENPWVTPAPAGSSSVLYMTIANGRQAPDTLLDARAPIIDSMTVHTASSDTAKAEGANSLPVPARTRVVLEPDGKHVTLANLGQALDANGTLILNLEFGQSGLQRLRVPVRTSAPTQ